MSDFVIREYGRQELAQLYRPDIQPESAWKKLKHWIEQYPGLTERLSTPNYFIILVILTASAIA